MKDYFVHTVEIPNGETIAYRKAGNVGKTLVLLHGNMSSSAHWSSVIEELEGEYVVIAPDLRGFGDSSYNHGFDSLNELGRDVCEFLDVLGVEKFSVVGWSAGGGVALEVAASLGERVEKVVLLNSVPVTGFPLFNGNGELLRTKEEVAAHPVAVAPVLGALAAGNRDFMKFVWDATIFKAVKPCDEEYKVYLDATMKQRCLVDIDFALLTFDFRDRFCDVKGKVVLMHGADDMVVPMEWARKSLEFMPGAELVVLEGCGHSPFTDRPEVFFEVLRRVI